MDCGLMTRPLVGVHRNGPIYIAKKDGVELVDRPDGVLLRAEAYKRLAERGAFAAM